MGPRLAWAQGVVVCGGALAGTVPGVEGAWELEGAAEALDANEGGCAKSREPGDGQGGASCLEREGGPREGVVLGRGPRPRVGRAPPEPA